MVSTFISFRLSDFPTRWTRRTPSRPPKRCRLFVERAQEASSGFTLSAENAGAVAEITVRLDGLPLAIELAAARLGVFAPNELRDRLRSRLDVLGKGARDLPDRQRTLHSTIEWSYELLDEDECRVFELLSVFTQARLPDVEGTATAVHGDLDVVEIAGITGVQEPGPAGGI